MTKVIILFLLIHSCYGIIYRLNDSEYYRMPPLYVFDDYERCVREPGALYCVTRAELVSDTPNELLNMIQEYSQHTSIHYNHSKLAFALCVKQTCQKFYESSTVLSEVLEACLNESVWENYQLKVKLSGDYYCDDSPKYAKVDALDIFVAAFVLLILVINLIGSFYDFFVANDDEHDVQFLLYFSIRQNWRRLVHSSVSTEPRLNKLNSFNGIKTLTSWMVMMGHSIISSFVFLDNTRFIENIYLDLSSQPFLNGTQLIRTYFVISIFLVTYNLQLYSEKSTPSWTWVPLAILQRIRRVLPVYIFVIACTMTWVRFLGSGPAFNEVVLYETEHCRRDWWKHFLFINNYFDESHCSIPSWYLAADMQLYILAVIIFVFCRSTKSKFIVLSITLFLGIYIPALHIYYMDLDPFPLSSPTAIQNFFTADATFNYLYKRGHTNLAYCVCGLLLTYVTYYCQQNNFNPRKYKGLRIITWALVPATLGIMTLGAVFYQEGPRPSMLIRLLYASIALPLLSFFIIFLLWGFFMRIEDVYRGLLEWSGWRTSARMSYCAFLVHAIVIRLVGGNQTVLTHAALVHMMKNALLIIVASNVVAFPLYLLVESPFTRLLNFSISNNKDTLKNNVSNNTVVTVDVYKTRTAELSSTDKTSRRTRM